VIPNSFFEKIKQTEEFIKAFPAHKKSYLESILDGLPITLRSIGEQILSKLCSSRSFRWNEIIKMVDRDTIHQESDVRRLLEALVLQSSSFKDLEGSKEFLQAEGYWSTFSYF
jgi:hypothetical protein